MQRVLESIFGTTPAELENDGALQSIARAQKEAEAEGVEYTARPDINVSLQYITPNRARLLQERMIDHQRNLSDRHVKKLVMAMISSRFYTIHQGIAILDTGETADGQHRLEAIVRSKRPQWMIVVSGISKEALLAIDRGRARTQANFLDLMGKPYASVFASSSLVVLKAMLAWDRGLKISSAQTEDIENYDQQDMINEMYENSDNAALSSASRKMNKVPGVPTSVGGGFLLPCTHSLWW